MSLSLLSNYNYLAYGISIPLQADGGTGPYVFSVVNGSSGGSVSSEGIYTSGFTAGFDVVQVQDASGDLAFFKVYTGTVFHLLADIIQKQMGLKSGRVYLFDQKIFMPTDDDLFVAISVLRCNTFGSKSQFDPDVNKEVISCNFYADAQIDVISRSTEALLRKEEVVMALTSQYSERQQQLNAFHIGRLPTNFVNLSNVDGAAIPYRFSITCGLQYSTKKIEVGDYFDTFESPELTVN